MCCTVNDVTTTTTESPFQFKPLLPQIPGSLSNLCLSGRSVLEAFNSYIYNSWPWTVKIYFQDATNNLDIKFDYKTRCGGTIVSDRLIVTNSECCVGNLKRVWIDFPTTSNIAGYKIDLPGDDTVIGDTPDDSSNIFIQNLANSNVCLIKTNLPISVMTEEYCEIGSNCPMSICIRENSIFANEGASCWGVGFESPNVHALEAKPLNILPHDYCIDHSVLLTQDKLSLLTTSSFCAANPDETVNNIFLADVLPCHKDIGFPLVCDEDGQLLLSGIISRKLHDDYNCHTDGIPPIYQQPNNAWIQDHIDAAGKTLIRILTFNYFFLILALEEVILTTTVEDTTTSTTVIPTTIMFTENYSTFTAIVDDACYPPLDTIFAPSDSSRCFYPKLGTKVDEFPLWGPSFSVSLDIKVLENALEKKQNIFSFENEEHLHLAALYLSKTENKLAIRGVVDSEDHAVNFDVDKSWNHLEIRQEVLPGLDGETRGYFYFTILLNGAVIHRVKNLEARAYRNVNVYFSSGDYPAASGVKIKNFNYGHVGQPTVQNDISSCFQMCGNKGGFCAKCGGPVSGGFCCSNDLTLLNGDCPADLVNALVGYGEEHRCVYYSNPLASIDNAYPVPNAESNCLQDKLDQYCRNLGTDDPVDIVGENANCNDVRFARFDGLKWRCYQQLRTDAESIMNSCISPGGRLVQCQDPDDNYSQGLKEIFWAEMVRMTTYFI